MLPVDRQTNRQTEVGTLFNPVSCNCDFTLFFKHSPFELFDNHYQFRGELF